jgi:hypothetical protein
MIKSEILICTFSSNVTRFVALSKDLIKCISLDSGWYGF